MISEDFDRIVDQQINLCANTLIKKADEYATEDRLHNFKIAAAMQGVPLRQAVAGMMAKHTVSIYDMCEAEHAFTISLWDEKITDHINYLLLLAAIVREEHKQNDTTPGLMTAKDYA